jgi:GntR family transcriptional regulator
MAAIVGGRYAVGALLPTEHELCELFQSSRFTVREALRLLAEAGMVSRRPRAGTVVVSAVRRQPYVQALDSIEDLLQYSAATRLRSLGKGWVTHQPGQTMVPPIPEGEAWFCVSLLRHLPGDDRPVCLTRVYLGPLFAPLAARITKAGQPVYRMIEAQYGVRVARVEQRISACALDRETALALRSRTGGPALRIVREYYGDNGQILEVSDSIHPADRFSYAMTICQSFPARPIVRESGRAGRTVRKTADHE